MSRLVLGVQPVREAIRVHKHAIEKVLINIVAPSNGRENVTLQRLADFARGFQIEVVPASRARLDSLTKNAMHQGVIAYAPPLKLLPLDQWLQPAPSLAMCLDRINDPQNFGAIIRSSVAFGAASILWPEHDSAPLSPATFRASAGAVEHARLCRVNALPTVLTMAQDSQMQVIGLAGDADTELSQLDLTAPTMLVVGAEATGLRKSVRHACSQLARLPTMAPLTTLNASVSAAVALYEVRRQRLQSASTTDNTINNQ